MYLLTSVIKSRMLHGLLWAADRTKASRLTSTNICPLQSFMLYLLLLYHVLQHEIKSPAGYKVLSPSDW